MTLPTDEPRDPRLTALRDAADAGHPELPSFAELEATLDREDRAHPLAALPSTRRGLLLAGAVTAVLATLAALARRPDLAACDPMHLALELGALAVPLVATAWLALRGPHQPRVATATVVAALGIALVVPFVIASVPLAPHVPFLAPPPPAGAPSVPCLVLGAGLSLVTFFVLRALDRGGPTGVPAAAAAACVGGLGLTLHCDLVDVPHRLVSHAPLAAIFVGTYAVAAYLARRR